VNDTVSSVIINAAAKLIVKLNHNGPFRQTRQPCSFLPAPKAGTEKPKESTANTDKVTSGSLTLTMKTA
jgi:hypothetical protein